jgi:hypothetical protein
MHLLEDLTGAVTTADAHNDIGLGDIDAGTAGVKVFMAFSRGASTSAGGSSSGVG